ncbi:peptidase P60 [Pararhizobium mangrovi]|uniref:Peptidase P60 n=2 Tax=Pararhizobium mangrovi TaxID=2590452 RepID=A0A506UHG9_9HYPH|nr:peptidase P60 [Pararhizobium mangrovi]
MSGDLVVLLARGWLGTPYRHQASRKNVGCDCLGLVRGVWRELFGWEPEKPGTYASDWAERAASDRLMAAARRHCLKRRDGMRPGDVILFRWRPGLPAKHCGIVSGEGRFIHAYEQAGVIESALVPAWRKRVAGVFSMPGR